MVLAITYDSIDDEGRESSEMTIVEGRSEQEVVKQFCDDVYESGKGRVGVSVFITNVKELSHRIADAYGDRELIESL